uniref:Uncharacterized protein n=1 Tax=Rhizophora mucronata TaxID=61149 RepID=A0A2P2QMQ5_RHIMU
MCIYSCFHSLLKIKIFFLLASQSKVNIRLWMVQWSSCLSSTDI